MKITEAEKFMGVAENFGVSFACAHCGKRVDNPVAIAQGTTWCSESENDELIVLVN